MEVLVTGADGFIGKRLCPRLLKKGHSVSAVVRHIQGNELAKNGRNEIRFLEADILDYNSLHKALQGKKFDCCIHLASFSNSPSGPEEERLCFSTNVEGTKNTLNALGGKKGMGFVFMSSAKVYGSATGIVDESSPLIAEDAYSKSKIEAEKAVESAASAKIISAVILRPSNSYGPGDLSFQRIVPGSLNKIFSGEQPVVYGDGSAVKNFIFVDDTVEAIISAAKMAASMGLGYETINLASGQNISIRALDGIIIKECNSNIEPLFLRNKKGESAPEISSLKAERLLGWKPRTSIEDGIKATVSWYKEYFAKAAKPPQRLK